MAKCNLGKVKIELMIVVGCVFWGQQITPKAHATQCGVVARTWCPPPPPSLMGHFACVFVNCGS